MTYKMFIDDERMPIGNDWIICRTLADVQRSYVKRGPPNFISFDHDLGDGQASGYKIVQWIIEADLDKKWIIPEDFDYYVHSQNPVGKENIKRLINGYLFKHK